MIPISKADAGYPRQRHCQLPHLVTLRRLLSTFSHSSDHHRWISYIRPPRANLANNKQAVRVATQYAPPRPLYARCGPPPVHSLQALRLRRPGH